MDLEEDKKRFKQFFIINFFKAFDHFYMGFLAGIACTTVIVSIILNGTNLRLCVVDRTQPKKDETAQITDKEIKNKLKSLESHINQYFMETVDKKTLADGMYRGMVESLGDVYSTYYTKEEYASIMEKSDGKYCGIGAVMAQSASTGAITVNQVYEGSPAEKGGMLSGDVLLEVENQSVEGMELSAIVALVKGEEGTEVSMAVAREGQEEPVELKIKRGKVEVPTVTNKMLKENIGYIRITGFEEVTVGQFKNAVEALEKAGEEGLIIDLRDNGGGLLTSVVSMSDYMLPKGLIMYTEDKYGEGEKYKSSDKEQFSKPLVLLINGNTASASEVFTGAIQDYNMGVVVGTTSFGKGIVQSIMPLQDGSAIKLTTAKYFTPKGRNLHGNGLEPDVYVEPDDTLNDDTMGNIAKDNQLRAAVLEMEKLIK